MSRLPDTTDLVFVEGKLSGTNPLFAAVRPVARVRPFPLAGPGDLRQWIRGRAEAEGVLIEPRAVDALAETVGADLRVAASELRKLALYRWGETVTYSDVQELVSYAREANIFAAVDAVIEGRMPSALRQVHQILSSGRPAGYIISMMARQVRLLILAKELKSRRVGGAEQGRRLGLSGYPLRKTLEQEPKLSAGHLVEIHGKLLEADRSTKTTGIAEELTLDLLVAEICMSHGSNQTP
jgi:DNA polymerase-3 subunit delta